MSHTFALTPWPNNITAAIFDFDGTLAETWTLWRFVDETFFAERGLPYDESASQALTTLGFAAGAQWCVERYELPERPQDIVDEWNKMGSSLYAEKACLRPGAEAYLKRLRTQGIRLALATTNDPEVLSSMAPRVDVAELFDAIVCGKEVAHGKDSPDIYLEAARRLDVAPVSCIVFEDIVPGVLSARSVGMASCGVFCEDPKQDRAALTREADLVIENWLDAKLGT